MFGPLGFPELVFILVLSLLIFGPRRLPEMGRTVGKALAEFRKATTDLKRTINAELIQEELASSDPRKLIRNEVSEIKATVARSVGGSTSDAIRTLPETINRELSDAVSDEDDGLLTETCEERALRQPPKSDDQ